MVLLIKLDPKFIKLIVYHRREYRNGKIIKAGYFQISQLSFTEIRERREEAEKANKDGEKLMKDGRYREAIEKFGNVPDPDDIVADLNLGKIFLLNREYSNAIGHFTTALDIDSTNTEAYLGLIEAYEKTGQNDRMLDSMEKYILFYFWSV